MSSLSLLGSAALATVVSFHLLGCDGFSNSKSSNNEARTSRVGEKNPFPAGSVYEKPNDGPFSEDRMLVNIGVNLLQRDVRSFRLKSDILLDQVTNACVLDPSSTDYQTAWISVQNSWKQAMLAYHSVDAVAVGPLLENKSELRSQIYAWPFISPCDIDLEVEAWSSGGGNDVNGLEVNARGLGALEYLLFTPNEKSTCNLRAHPQMKAWNEKPLVEKKKDRCVMSEKLAQNLVEKARILDQRWDINEGNFAKSFIDQKADQYPEYKTATQELMYGLFSLEKLKDERLAKPLGLSKLCTNDDKKCPEAAEHALSGIALAAVRAHVLAFQSAFFGSRDPNGIGFGFDDFLISSGRQDTVDEMKRDFVQLLTTLSEVESQGNLQEQISGMDAAACAATTVTDRQVNLCALYHDVRELTTVLKTDILTTLSLSAPAGYQGDND